MTKAREAVSALLEEAERRQKDAADSVATAERTLVKRRKVLAAADAEVAELRADLAKLDGQSHLKLVG